MSSPAADALNQLAEAGRKLVAASKLLGKPIVITETGGEYAPGASVVVGLYGSADQIDELLRYLQRRYPNADIETLDEIDDRWEDASEEGS